VIETTLRVIFVVLAFALFGVLAIGGRGKGGK